MAAYVDHGLSLAERARVETHLASCPQCTELLAGVVRTVADLPAPMPGVDGVAEAPPLVSRRTVAGAAAAAAAVIAVLVAPSLVRTWLEPDAGLVSLVGSVGEHRSVLGRLTGGIPHAPLGSPPAGGQGGKAAETGRVLMTAGKIRESFGDLQTPARLHAYGVSELLAGRHNEAAHALIAAAREQPDNARFLNDVATLHLERARLGLRPDDLPRAYAAADRARRLNPSLLEAWFNRALAATSLTLTDQARTAWREYLERDSASPWASEARRRLEELSRPTPAQAWVSIEGSLQRSIDGDAADYAVRAHTTEARRYIEDVLFVDWADAVSSGRGADAALERLRVMANAMRSVAGDSLYTDAVAAIDRASAGGRAAELALAHRTYAGAARLLREDRYAEASAGLSESAGGFAAAGSPVAELSAVGLGTVAYYGGRYQEAEQVLSRVQDTAISRGYAFPLSRATWIRGMIAFAQGRYGDAQALYEDSLATSERMGDVEQAAGAHNLLSGLAYHLGDKGTEWRHRQLALAALTVSRSPRFHIPTLLAAAVATRAENPEAALAMLDGVVTAAKAAGREAAIVDALAQRASTLLALGRGIEASESSAEAREHVARIPDTNFRGLLELPVLSVESDLQRAIDPARAAASAQRAIDTATARGDRARLPQFQLRLAKANIVWGRFAEAERALNAGILAFDETRARPAGVSGISAFDESWELFETAVRLAVRRGDHERAFAMAERARAMSSADAGVSSLAQAQRATRPDEAIVALNQFDDELLIWVIRNQQASVVIHPLRRVDARQLIGRQQDENRIEAAWPGAGAALYDTLLRPVAAHLAGVSRIVFVPDATYQDVSFPALWDRSRQRFLVEDAIVSTAPTVTALRPAGGARQGEAADRALIVAADVDAPATQTIAGAYRAPVIPARDSTPGRFLTDAAASGVIHLSVPTYANAAYPMLSRLVLGDEPGRRYSGTILGRDIASRDMTSTRLVVVDEIRSEQGYRAAGNFTLARAFLAAGVPAVLGTLPGADEAATRRLMVGFHRHVAGQASAAEALARIQRSELQGNGRRLGAWSALVVYGSDR